MNIAYAIDKIEIQNVFFLESKKNMIMDGKFTKIVYSDECISTNGITIATPFRNITNDSGVNKSMMKFQTQDANNATLSNRLIDIEEQLLDYYKNITQNGKSLALILRDHMKNGSIKVYHESPTKSNATYILKISGIWEDPYRIGLTYKFIEVTRGTYP